MPGCRHDDGRAVTGAGQAQHGRNLIVIYVALMLAILLAALDQTIVPARAGTASE